MPIADLMFAGVELLFLGMGIVFGFLTLLVFTLRGMSRLAAVLDRRPPELAGDATSGVGAVAATPLIGPADEGELAAVIAAAIARHRADRHR